jgi:hypothetical protein
VEDTKTSDSVTCTQDVSRLTNQNRVVVKVSRVRYIGPLKSN